jgi:hypothetical protein
MGVANEAFAFAPSQDASSRTFDNVALMWTAPWRAYWAFTFETMNPDNYRL